MQKDKTAGERGRRRGASYWFRLGGNVLMLAAFIFIIRRLLAMELDYRAVFVPANIPALAGIILVYALIVAVSFFPWWLLLKATAGRAMPIMETVRVSTRSNLMKYIPGNVFQFIGRNELAVAQDVSHPQVAAATVGDMGVQFLSGVTIGLVFGANSLGRWLSMNMGALRWVLAALGVFILVLAVLCIVFHKKIGEQLKAFKALLTLRNLGRAGTAYLFYCVTSLATSALYLLVMRLFGAVPLREWGFIVGVFILSWLVGYMTPGVPGGIGVRELLMTVLSAGAVDGNLILPSMVLFRFISVFGDVLAFAVVASVYRVRSRSKGRVADGEGGHPRSMRQ